MSGEVIGRFFVAGRPRTKGSLTPQMSRGAGGKIRVHLVESGEYAVPWKRTMIAEIKRAGVGTVPYAGAVEVQAIFRFDKTFGVGHEVWPSHDTDWPTAIDIGDWDKLSRNLLDALTQSGLIRDDRLVVGSGQTWKRWCRPGEVPGVDVLVLAAPDPESIP